MKNFSLIVVFAIVLFAVALPLHAQGGCENSPENPTVILGLISAAGVGIFQLRSRMKPGTNK